MWLDQGIQNPDASFDEASGDLLVTSPAIAEFHLSA